MIITANYGNKLCSQEALLLLSADEAGWIPFPEGNHREVCAYLDALSQMDKKHLVQRRMRNGYRAYHLTKMGDALRSQIIASKMNE
jgi:hypothetical protein